MGIRRRSSQAGFTLSELMVTGLVVAIVAAIAAPSYRTIIRSGLLTTQIYDFNAGLTLARSEAVKRGMLVTVCPSTNQVTCGDSGTEWEQGWIIFVDANKNHAVDEGDAMLRAAPALATGYTLRATSTTTLPDYFAVDPKGNPNDSGTFVLCEGGAINPSRAVLVSIVGRISLAPDADNDGIPEGAADTNLASCTP